MVTIGQFMEILVSNPFLLVVMTLILGSIFVNGSTDAANAIAEPVGTRSIGVNQAIVMSVICNFVGLVGMTLVSTAVADTMSGMVDFGGDTHAALIALAAATVGIVGWGVGAWIFGIPTSESHALIAGLTGAALAVHGGLGGVNGAEWVKVIYGLVLSTVLGYAAGWVISKVIPRACRQVDRRHANDFFGRMQVLGAAGVALMHGAQDGQKFMSTAMMAIVLASGSSSMAGVKFPLWIMVLCAGVMALGTAVGGKKIIKTVGMSMVQLDKYQGFAASVSATVSLLVATLTGLPVSTTHTKTAAIMGAGAAENVRSVNWAIARDMVLTWVFTFPGCGIIGFVLARLFLIWF
ncbi:PiT family inorganic phosphate transporter [Olsenella profusa DSM 13989]|uniref:inorganic phosphate transporter n=1 Tax=Olsenella profusa TaxID=138595 RepID=UPI00277D7915|nr:inorganic phosphate transporter [Olsenella profusa]MDP9858565.1 PiT family inorganic phosphate transporter [Olsenella profusa DSM 13989]